MAQMMALLGPLGNYTDAETEIHRNRKVPTPVGDTGSNAVSDTISHHDQYWCIQPVSPATPGVHVARTASR